MLAEDVHIVQPTELMDAASRERYPPEQMAVLDSERTG
jgi:hypothetical protein